MSSDERFIRTAAISHTYATVVLSFSGHLPTIRRSVNCDNAGARLSVRLVTVADLSGFGPDRLIY
jgi:hypothetical protein